MKIQLSGFLVLCLFFITTCDEPTKPDNNPPTIIITSPRDGLNVSGIVTITCESTDDEGVEKVELWVDGISTNIIDSQEPYSLDWDTTPYESGSSHIIIVRAFDKNGNIADSEPITLNTYITFVKTFGDEIGYSTGSTVQQTNDGGYIITGYTNLYGAGQQDLWLIKTDGFGNLIWDKTFGGEYNDLGNFVQQTTDGGYIIIGTTEIYNPDSWITGDNYKDIWLIKTDDVGDTLWTKTIGVRRDPHKSTYSLGITVLQISDGGYVIVGTLDSYSILIKTNEFGDTLWTKKYGVYNYPNSVQQTTDGGYVFLNQNQVSGTGDYFQIIKTDYVGNEIWSQNFDGINDIKGYSVQQTTDGGYIITGGTSPGGGTSWEVILIKMDSQGSEIWNKTYGEQTQGEIGYSVQQTSDGGYIVSGIDLDKWDVLLMKTDAVGDTLWTKTFTWGDYPIISRGWSVHQTTDSGYVITGRTGGGQLFLIKTDSEGNTEL